MQGTCIMIPADLSKPEECARVVNETIQQLGDIDILIHSAGSAAPGSLLSGAKDVWYQAFDIHIHAAFHLSMAAVPSMKKKKEGCNYFNFFCGRNSGSKECIGLCSSKRCSPTIYPGSCF
jgi:NADP-dependent 3-hydroxy acid dehydrogenase YdfG